MLAMRLIFRCLIPLACAIALSGCDVASQKLLEWQLRAKQGNPAELREVVESLRYDNLRPVAKEVLEASGDAACEPLSTRLRDKSQEMIAQPRFFKEIFVLLVKVCGTKSIPILAELARTQGDLQHEAAEALGAFRTPEVTAVLVELLNVRGASTGAANVLRQVGESAFEGTLAVAMDRQGAAPGEALRALGAMGPRGKTALAKIACEPYDPAKGPFERAPDAAIQELLNSDGNAELFEIARKPECPTRHRAIEFLATRGGLDVLFELTRDETVDPTILAHALARGKDASHPRLIAMLQSGSRREQEVALEALHETPTASAIPAVVSKLGDRGLGIKAAGTLGAFVRAQPDKAMAAFDPLARLAVNKKDNARSSAALALGGFARARAEVAMDAFQILAPELDDSDEHHRRSVSQSLARFQTAQADALLLGKWKAGDDCVIVGASRRFLKLDPGPDTADRLVRALHQCGTVKVAQHFLNSGDPRLREGGRTWANRNRYQILEGFGAQKDEE